MSSQIDSVHIEYNMLLHLKQEACRPIQPAPHSNYSVLQQMPARGC